MTVTFPVTVPGPARPAPASRMGRMAKRLLELAARPLLFQPPPAAATCRGRCVAVLVLLPAHVAFWGPAARAPA